MLEFFVDLKLQIEKDSLLFQTLDGKNKKESNLK
jgi:hypothetical protein